ncbi:hypothetical protein HW555_008474 [Spodoptera exigua]|uniref:Uncharacterized protein n=1 Tax=Spodoptera exigua TaxID=7107 RepID=A0A835GEV0_SPOEX|nr:hypothetical protein HW555_008474 [Spodoptera exigua]
MWSSQLLDSDRYELVPVINPNDGTRVATRGLCPVQQEQGMECCRPTSQDVTCHSKGGECVSNHYKCPRLLEVKEANDCGLDNTCCAFV